MNLMSSMFTLESHLEETLQALEKVDLLGVARVVDILEVSRKQNSFVWLIGNGGSASTASHFANDLQKQCGIRAVALPDMTPLITAHGNDDAWQRMFSNALNGYARAGDVVIAFSCSGNSENVIRATSGFFGEAIIFTGDNRDSKLIQNANASVIVYVESSDIMVQESVHLAVCHAIVAALKPEKRSQSDTVDAVAYGMHWVKPSAERSLRDTLPECRLGACQHLNWCYLQGCQAPANSETKE